VRDRYCAVAVNIYLTLLKVHHSQSNSHVKHMLVFIPQHSWQCWKWNHAFSLIPESREEVLFYACDFVLSMCIFLIRPQRRKFLHGITVYKINGLNYKDMLLI